jgi:hypothetical protein
LAQLHWHASGSDASLSNRDAERADSALDQLGLCCVSDDPGDADDIAFG